MLVDIVIQLRRDKAYEDRIRSVFKIAEEVSISFVPLDPAACEGPLGDYFHATVPEQSAQEIVESLRRTPGVTAAYIKPAGRPPR